MASLSAGEVTRNLVGFTKAEAQGKLRIVIMMPSGIGSYGSPRYVKFGNKYELGFSIGGGRLFGIGIRTSNSYVAPILRIDYWDPRYSASHNPFVHYHVGGGRTHHPIWHP
jgi:hypothetical protein